MRTIPHMLALLILAPLTFAGTPEQDRDAGATAIKGLYDAATAANARAADLGKQLDAANGEIARLKAATRPAEPAYTVKAGGDLAAAVKAAKAGAVVTAEPATYAQALTVGEGVTLRLERGVILTGRVHLNGKGAKLIGGTVRGHVFPSLAADLGAVQCTGDDAVVDGVTFERITGAAVGVTGDRARVVNCELDTVSQPIRVGTADKTLNVGTYFGHNKIRHVNVDKWATTDGPGVGKSTRTDGLVIEFNAWEDVVGPCVWLDIQHSNFRVTDNTAKNVRGVTANWQGSFFVAEICNAGESLVARNATSGCTGSDIAIWESNGITVEGNTYGTAIELRNMANRGYGDLNGVFVPTPLKDILIKNNKGPKADHLSIGAWPAPTAKPWAAALVTYLADHDIVWQGNVKN